MKPYIFRKINDNTLKELILKQYIYFGSTNREVYIASVALTKAFKYNKKRCIICNAVLIGRQRKYCERHSGRDLENYLYKLCPICFEWSKSKVKWKACKAYRLDKTPLFKCAHCKELVTEIEIHHKKPLYSVKTLKEKALLNIPKNLVALCTQCHLEKHKEIRFNEKYPNQTRLEVFC